MAASHKLLLLMRPLRTVSSFLASGRKPLITFPIRRDDNGRPMTETSLDIFHGSNSSTSSSVTSNVDKSITSHHIVTSLPFDFGRKPITDEEMEAINSGGV